MFELPLEQELLCFNFDRCLRQLATSSNELEIEQLVKLLSESYRLATAQRLMALKMAKNSLGIPEPIYED